MKKLQIAENLSLPADAVTEKLAWLGTTGGGKSYAAMKFAELLDSVDAQFVVLDYVGIWYGLRLAADGKSPGIPIPLFGGLRGDLPLEPTAGELMANLIVDKGISVILDVSQFEDDSDKAKFGRAFADRFFFRKKASPSAVHLFLEEAQEFIPQDPQANETKMVHAFNRLQKIGRNFGIGTSIISQRPQEISKKALNLAQTLFVFRTTGPHERKAIATWMADKGLSQDLAADLPKLPTGTAHCWSPQFLGISETVKVAERWTFDSSATPKLGATAKKAKDLAPIDLEKIRDEMAATIEKAKAEDLKELRKRIAQLERELKAKPAAAPVVTTVDQRAIAAAVREAVKPWQESVRDLRGRLDRVGKMFARSFKVNEEIAGELLKDAPKLPDLPKIGIVSESGAPNGHARAAVIPTAQPARRDPKPTKATDGISRSQQRILDTLAMLESIGIAQPSRSQLALWCDVSPTSGGYFNNLGALRTAGLIDYPQPATVVLTAAGRSVAATPDPPAEEEMHAALYSKVGASKARILQALIDIYPKSITRDALAERVGVSPTSGGYFNNLGALRTLGVIDYPRQGEVAATPILFLEG